MFRGTCDWGAKAKAVIVDPASDLVLPATALAEACWIVQVGRTSIPSPAHVLQAVDADLRVGVVPLDRDIVERTLGLHAIGETHDRQIVATALRLIDAGETAILLKKDANITASGLVPVLW